MAFTGVVKAAGRRGIIQSFASALESDPAKAGLEPWRVTRPTSRTAFSSHYAAREMSPRETLHCVVRAGGRGGIIQSFASALESDPAKAALEPWRVTRPTSRTAFSSHYAAREMSPRETLHCVVRAGGRGGIRTHGGFNPTLDFESSAFNRTQPPFLCPGEWPALWRENYEMPPEICKQMESSFPGGQGWFVQSIRAP